MEKKFVLYEKCLKCEKLGNSCNCMSFIRMSAPEIIEWCKARKTMLKMTNETLSTLSGVPMGTVNRIFAGKGSDFYYETLRPIVKALVSGDWEGDKCHTAEDVPEHSADTIRRLEKENEYLKAECEYIKQENHDDTGYLKTVLHTRKIAIIILAVLLGITLSVIIVALVIDRMNPYKGFFWLA